MAQSQNNNLNLNANKYQITHVFNTPTLLHDINYIDWNQDGSLFLHRFNESTIEICYTTHIETFHLQLPNQPNIDYALFCKWNLSLCLIAASYEDDINSYGVYVWNFNEQKLDHFYPLKSRVTPVYGLVSHPSNNFFIASCINNHLYLFGNKQLLMTLEIFSTPVVAFDHEGLIFSCSLHQNVVSLFSCDGQDYLSGEFARFDLSQHFKNPDTTFIQALVFSPDGDKLVVSAPSYEMLAIDAYTGKKICDYTFPTLEKQQESTSKNFIPSFSPDGKFVLCGLSDNAIHIWTAQGQWIHRLIGHSFPPRFISFNLRKVLFASAGIYTCWWQIPLTHSQNALETNQQSKLKSETTEITS